MKVQMNNERVSLICDLSCMKPVCMRISRTELEINVAAEVRFRRSRLWNLNTSPYASNITTLIFFFPCWCDTFSTNTVQDCSVKWFHENRFLSLYVFPEMFPAINTWVHSLMQPMIAKHIATGPEQESTLYKNASHQNKLPLNYVPCMQLELVVP